MEINLAQFLLAVCSEGASVFVHHSKLWSDMLWCIPDVNVRAPAENALKTFESTNLVCLLFVLIAFTPLTRAHA